MFSCIVPPISNGYLFSDGEILQEGEILNYSGLVSVKCNQGFGVLTHTEADNLVQCDEETDAWNKQFLSCQSSYHDFLTNYLF